MAVNFRGLLFDDSGNAIQGATVQLLDQSGTQEASTTTSSAGLWSFSESDEDNYDIKITQGSSVRWIQWDDQISLKEIDVRNDTGNTTPAATFTNTTNNASNQVANFRGLNTTRADGDEIYLSFTMANSAGEAHEFARMTVDAVDVTDGDEDGQIRFSVSVDGTKTDVFTINSSESGGTDMTLDVSGDLVLDADGGDIFFKDAGTTFGSATNNSGNLILKSGTTAAATFSGANVTFAGTVDATTDFTIGTTVITDDSIVMTPSTSDTVTIAGATNGALNITTVDNDAAAANIRITADGTVDIDSAGVLTLDSGAAINIEPASGSAILLDGTISIDAGVVTGATSITSTAFVGDITGDVTGTADVATVATTVTITDNESTNENNALIFTSGGDLDGGNIGLESDGDLYYNPSSSTLTVPNLTVAGTTTTVNSTTVTIDDPIFTLGGDTAPGSDDNKDRGIEFRYHDGSSARIGFFGFDDSTGKFTALTVATNSSEVFSGTAMPAIFGNVEAATISGTTGTFTGVVDITDTTDSSDASGDTGALRTEGGASIAKKLYVGTDADIDGTLEADAITVDGTTLAEFIADTVGAMVTSNTESGITVAYQDADNTLDFTVGTLNQDTTGTAAIATTVTITDNESTDEDNAIIFTAGGDVDGGNLGLESDGNLTYNPSTGRLTATQLAGTLQTASQTNITAVGTIGTGVWQGTAIASAYIAADAITGAKIADDAIDSEHYTDASIDNAHLADNAVDTAEIADNAVTLAKMASGTDGNIISYDASGNPVAIATGTDGQVLTSTGAGSPPAFEDAAGGGAWTFIGSTGSLAGIADVEFTAMGTAATTKATSIVNALSAGTYDHYAIMFQNVAVADDDVHVKMWLSITSSGTAAYDETAGIYHFSNGGNSFMYVGNGLGNASNEVGIGGIVYIHAPHRAEYTFVGMSNLLNVNRHGVVDTIAGSLGQPYYASYLYASTTAVTGFLIENPSGNFSAGEIVLYGLKNA